MNLTEAQWLAGDDPRYLIEFLHNRIRPEHVDLFLAAGASRYPQAADGIEVYAILPSFSSECQFIAGYSQAFQQFAGARVTDEQAIQCRHLRCLFGNPFRPRPAFDPFWRTWSDGAIPRIARAIAADGDFGRLLILADALEEAGCQDEWLLRHCRGFEWCGRCAGTGRSEYDFGYFPPPREPCPDCGAIGWRCPAIPHAPGCWVVELLRDDG